MEPMTIPAMAPPERVVDEVVLVLSAVVARVIVAVAAVMVVVAWRMARAGVGVSGRAGMVETGLGLWVAVLIRLRARHRYGCFESHAFSAPFCCGEGGLLERGLRWPGRQLWRKGK